MERRKSEEEIRKGPWTAEEDEILINFVKENGPRDWSSIRSKGLLPRTGKSCRLRWVNKLRPNLKKGCKFSAEEERLVLDLQATFGNKWAAIASYLPGRTDNDVKNFWSTRQKRLARILRSSSHSSRSHKNKGKVALLNEASSSQAPKSSSKCNKVKEASLQCELCSCFCSENHANTINMLPPADLLNPYYNMVDHVNTSLPQLENVHTTSPNDTKLTPTFASPFQVSLSWLPQPILNFPFQPENQDFYADLGEPNFNDIFTCQEANFEGNSISAQINFGLSLEDLEGTDQNYERVDKDKITVPDNNLFDDLPADMFDNLETVPRSSAF